VGVKTESEWEALAKGLLKAELKRRHVSYQQLADKLADAGVKETPQNIANKISRGRFTAVFMLQCLSVIGCNEVRIS
jgi:3-mercaptopyruvate sulfurtransferase SseA